MKRQFDDLLRNIYETGATLLDTYDKLEFSTGRVNGYKIPATVYAALYEFVLRTSNLHEKVKSKKTKKLESEIWLNSGGLSINNEKVKRFKVVREEDGTIILTSTLIEIENGLAPFDDVLAACCGNHCSNGSYDICSGGALV